MKNKVLHAVEAINILMEGAGHYKDFKINLDYEDDEVIVRIVINNNHDAVINMFEEMFGKSEQVGIAKKDLCLERYIQGNGFKMDFFTINRR